MKTIVQEKVPTDTASPPVAPVAAEAVVQSLPVPALPLDVTAASTAPIPAPEAKSTTPADAMMKVDNSIANETKPSVSIDDPCMSVDAAANGASKLQIPTPAGATVSTLQTPILNQEGVNQSPSLEIDSKKRKASKDLTKDEKAADLEAGAPPAPPTAFLG